MSLRATFGDMTEAVDWIIRKREEDVSFYSILYYDCYFRFILYITYPP